MRPASSPDEASFLFLCIRVLPALPRPRPPFFFSLPSRFPISGFSRRPAPHNTRKRVSPGWRRGGDKRSPLIALGVKCVDRQGRIAEWRATVRALLRAARGIENATVRHKVTRNVYLACRLLSSEEANPDKVGKAEQKEKGHTLWYEKETRAAIRVITELASIPQRDLEQKFHSIHQVRPFRQDKTTLQSGQQEGPEREEPNP